MRARGSATRWIALFNAHVSLIYEDNHGNGHCELADR